jgi:hypothetical protein
VKRPQKITFGEMRSSGVGGLLVYCSDFKCSHSTKISGDRWPDHIRLSDIEPLFVCQACGRRAPKSSLILIVINRWERWNLAAKRKRPTWGSRGPMVDWKRFGAGWAKSGKPPRAGPASTYQPIGMAAGVNELGTPIWKNYGLLLFGTGRRDRLTVRAAATSWRTA